MRTNYWPLGFGLVALSLLLPWFDPVTTPRFNGLNFPFAHSAYLWPRHFVFLFAKCHARVRSRSCSRAPNLFSSAGFSRRDHDSVAQKSLNWAKRQSSFACRSVNA